jgi:protein involved in polysaccharide export with SLBB domain
MNFLSKLTLLPCAALMAGIMLSGCKSADEPVLSDNPNPPTMTEVGGGTKASATTTNGTSTGTTPATGGTNDDLSSVQSGAPRFQAGETVTVNASTGSDLDPGPIATPQSCLIADDGTITLPLIGTVQAAGKTPGELQDIVTKLYVPQYYIRLAVTVTAPNRVYYVGGEVAHPGPEEYIGETTVTRAIQAAGDLTQFASHTVWLTRADGTRIRVKVNDALRDSSKDPAVYPGDQIHVPRRYF